MGRTRTVYVDVEGPGAGWIVTGVAGLYCIGAAAFMVAAAGSDAASDGPGAGISEIAEAGYIRQTGEGQCVYEKDGVTRNVSFHGAKDTSVANTWRLVTLRAPEKWHFEIVGQVPVYGVTDCSVGGKTMPREQAVAQQKENAAVITARLEALAAEYPSIQSHVSISEPR